MREACRVLAEIRLVCLGANRGVFINQLSKADAIEVYDVGAGLIALASSLLCPMLSAARLAQLEALVATIGIGGRKR